MKTMQEVYADALTLSDADLDRLVKDLLREDKERFRRRSMKAALDFRPGDEVENVCADSRKLPVGVRGKVERFSGAFVLVDFGPYRKWRVPGDWLKRVSHAKVGGVK